MIQRIALFSIFLTLFTACYKDHLYVQQEWVDRNFLASSKVGTPDPRQANPPTGQRLLVAWRFPYSLYQRKLTLILTVRFWDHSEKQFCHSIESRKSYTAFNFYDEKILTYRIQIMDAEHEIIETWEHHFWTQLIEI